MPLGISAGRCASCGGVFAPLLEGVEDAKEATLPATTATAGKPSATTNAALFWANKLKDQIYNGRFVLEMVSRLVVGEANVVDLDPPWQKTAAVAWPAFHHEEDQWYKSASLPVFAPPAKSFSHMSKDEEGN